MARGIHTKPNEGESSDWLTPPEIVEALGQFDLDPCAHPAQFYRTAAEMIAPPLDGLSIGWQGRVWLNPPYGFQIHDWLLRLAEHGNGIALVPARTEVERWFWPYIWESADGLLFRKGRIWFHLPDGTQKGLAAFAYWLWLVGNRRSNTLDVLEVWQQVAPREVKSLEDLHVTFS